jgi:hypothetical protein
MKNQISKLILFMVPVMLLFSCNKDKFSEKDALNAQQTVDLLLTVIDYSSSMAPVEGATVTVVSDSTITTKTTSADGIVMFTNIAIGGYATVSVSKTDYTSVLTTVNTNPSSYRQTQVSDQIYLYGLGSANMATIKGRLTFQSDLTDRNREPAVGVVVKAINNNLNTQIFTSTTDADGKYSIAVPVAAVGDNIQMIFPEFTTDQTIAVQKPDKSFGVITRSVTYKSNEYPVGDLNNIAPVPSVYATIAAPAATAGSGFALSSKANRVPIASYSTATLIDGGAGYAKGRTVADTALLLSADPNGINAKIRVNITSGKITSIIAFVNNGATYSTAPSFLQNGGTTAAVISINFETTYKIYISNRGTGYNKFPLVSAETESYTSGTVVRAVDPDINDWGTVNLGNGAILTSYATIYGGIIKGVSNGDTLLTATANSFSSAPVFTVVNANSIPAVLAIYPSYISVDSTLDAIYIYSAGSGYNPSAPPAVTLTTLGGYGTGATAKVTVAMDGTIDAIYITNPGKKYVNNVNDFRKIGTTSSSPDYPDFPSTSFSNVRPGDVLTRDVYYGTGYQILNQSTGK